MIDEAVFKRTWVLLCDRFGRQPSTPLMQAYYSSLSPKMSTEAFRAAAQIVFERREFFPRPADFIEAVRPDTEAEALTQLEILNDLARGFGKWEQLNAEGKRVVGLLGGLTKIRNTPLDQMQYVRRDFLKLYGDAAEVARREGGELIEATPEGNRVTAALMEHMPRLAPGSNGEHRHG